MNALLFSRIVYRQVGEIVRANPAIEEPNHFYDFLARTYADHISAGIRRQLDVRKDTHSLRGLLRRIAKYPQCLSRERYVNLCAESKSDYFQDHRRKLANEEFDERHGKGSKHFDPQRAKEDEKRLVRISEDVVNHVNSHVAHLARRASSASPATFDQLDEALDEVHALVKRYRLELEARTLGDPVLAGPWLGIFRVPWIED